MAWQNVIRNENDQPQKKTRCCYKIIMNRVSAWWWQKREFLRCYTTCRLHVQTLFSGGEWEERDECKLIAWFELLFDFWNDELKNSFFPAFRRALPVFQFSFSCYIKKWFFYFLTRLASWFAVVFHDEESKQASRRMKSCMWNQNAVIICRCIFSHHWFISKISSLSPFNQLSSQKTHSLCAWRSLSLCVLKIQSPFENKFISQAYTWWQWRGRTLNLICQWVKHSPRFMKQKSNQRKSSDLKWCRDMLLASLWESHHITYFKIIV